MSESEIRAYAQERGFHRQTLERWLGWETKDRAALQDLAVSLKASENHLRDMMDWLSKLAIGAVAVMFFVYAVLTFANYASRSAWSPIAPAPAAPR